MQELLSFKAGFYFENLKFENDSDFLIFLWPTIKNQEMLAASEQNGADAKTSALFYQYRDTIPFIAQP